MQVQERIDGIAIGIFLGFREGEALVVFAANPREEALVARSMVPLTGADAGCEVGLLFEDGQPMRPLIIGKIVKHPHQTAAPEVVRDGETVVIRGEERIELRVGKASIVMEKDGHITIRGTYLVSHASASNRIRGGSVNLN